LEIGGRSPASLLDGVATWWSVDPLNPIDPVPDGPVRALRARAEALPAQIERVDAVFACNSFQHIADLAGAYREIARVLSPHGFVYACFGPIWTAPDGAHVENLVVDGRRYDFWTPPTLMPAWSHLTLSAGEYRALAAELHGRRLARALTDYVTGSDWINRATLRDHLSLPPEAGLEIVSARSASRFGYGFAPPKPPPRGGWNLGLAAAVAATGMSARELRARDLELVMRPVRR